MTHLICGLAEIVAPCCLPPSVLLINCGAALNTFGWAASGCGGPGIRIILGWTIGGIRIGKRGGKPGGGPGGNRGRPGGGPGGSRIPVGKRWGGGFGSGCGGSVGSVGNESAVPGKK